MYHPCRVIQGARAWCADSSNGAQLGSCAVERCHWSVVASGASLVHGVVYVFGRLESRAGGCGLCGAPFWSMAGGRARRGLRIDGFRVAYLPTGKPDTAPRHRIGVGTDSYENRERWRLLSWFASDGRADSPLLYQTRLHRLCCCARRQPWRHAKRMWGDWKHEARTLNRARVPSPAPKSTGTISCPPGTCKHSHCVRERANVDDVSGLYLNSPPEDEAAGP